MRNFLAAILISIPLLSGESEHRLHEPKPVNLNSAVTVRLRNGVQEYFDKFYPDAKLSPDTIAILCVQLDFDPFLLLAQARVESVFGTDGASLVTNSVFGVGAFNDSTNIYYYETPDHSVRHYIRTMKASYLNNKTIDELLSPGGFVNCNGDRYAEYECYEYAIRTWREEIMTIILEFMEREL